MPGVPHIKKLMRQTIKQAQVGMQDIKLKVGSQTAVLTWQQYQCHSWQVLAQAQRDAERQSIHTLIHTTADQFRPAVKPSLALQWDAFCTESAL